MPAPLTTSKARPPACDRNKRLSPSARLPPVGLVALRRLLIAIQFPHQRKVVTTSLLVKLDLAPTREPKHSKTLPGRLVSGDPSYKTWEQDSSRGDSVKTGVWEATPGENRSIKGETFEYCHILSGVVELTEAGKEPRIFRAGDSFVMKPGYVGVWKTIETVRKIYVVVSTAA
jgi:uncharacterized protein